MPRSLKSMNSPSRQLQHFTNRESEQAVLHRLLDLPQGHPLPVLMFWGVGGNGKSWLLRKLREALPSQGKRIKTPVYYWLFSSRGQGTCE